jgi:hypothetical protein
MQVLVPLLYNIISVAMEQGTVEHRMFAYDVYVKNAESITAVHLKKSGSRRSPCIRCVFVSCTVDQYIEGDGFSAGGNE